MAGKQNQKVKPRLLKGMQDSWPELARARREMLSEIEAVCRWIEAEAAASVEPV